jgi:hypothetical protein
LFLDLLKKSKGLHAILAFSMISQNCFCIGKVIDWVYGSQDHGWLSVHGGLTTMRWRGHSRTRDIIMIAQREREREEEVVGVLTNDATWRQRLPHDNAQLRGSVVLQWGDGSGHEDESFEPGGCGE